MHSRPRYPVRPLVHRAVWALVGFLMVGQAGQAQAQGTFSKYIPLTVNGGSITGGPHLDFPVMVDVSNGDLRTLSRGGSVAGYSGGRASVAAASTSVTFTDPLPDEVGPGDRLVFTGGPAETLTIGSRTGFYSVTLTAGAASAHTSQTFRIEGDDWAHDLVFRGDAATCNAASACDLAHEIELYDGIGGRVVAWVKAPQLVGGGVISMYYGNPALRTPTETPGAVWDAGYVGVWHLGETGNGTRNEYRDSTRYGNHGQGGQGRTAAIPKTVSGKVGSAQRFDDLVDGTYDFIDVGEDASLTLTGTGMTLEAWVYHNIPIDTAHGTPVQTGPGNPYGILNHKGFYDGYRLHLSGDSTSCPNPNGGAMTDPCFALGLPEQHHVVKSSQYGSPATDPLTRNQWHRVVGTYDGAEMKLYLDGQPLITALDFGNPRMVKPGTCPTPAADCAQVALGTNVVTFNVALPAAVAVGHTITMNTWSGSPSENFRIIAINGPRTQATVSANAVLTHPLQSYWITNPLHTGNIPPPGAEQHVFIGQGDQPQDAVWSAQFEGDLDEVRISNIARSAGWIATEFNNQNAPGTFLSTGGVNAAAQAITTFTTHYRSIGSIADYTAGTVTAVQGSAMVAGTGTTWRTSNRGQGDRIRIPCDDPPTCTGAVDYTIYSASDTQVRLTQAFTGTSGTYTHLIERKHGSPSNWENCIDGPGGAGCEGVTGSSLVADNRREVGVYFYEGSLLALPTVLNVSGSTTSPDHDITFTVDPPGRHGGAESGSPTWAAFFGSGAAALVRIQDDHVTVEWMDIYGGVPAISHFVHIQNVAPGNRITIRNMLLHDGGADGIRVEDPDANVDIYNNIMSDDGDADVGVRIASDLTAEARVNVFANTIHGYDIAGVASLTTGGARLRQTRPRVTLRNNIVHSNTIDLNVARAFDEAYFCTGMSGSNPTGCTSITGNLADDTSNSTLNFTGATTCLYVGSNDPFRSVTTSVATGGAGGVGMQWDYWSGAAWSSLETGTFVDYNFQWDDSAHWADDPPGWATRTVGAAVGARYYVRACLASGPNTSPVESLIVRGDVKIAGRYNLTSDKTAFFHSPWRGLTSTGVEDTTGSGVQFVSATPPENLHLQAGSMARDVLLDVPRGTGWESSALTGLFAHDIDAQGRPAALHGDCQASGAACWDIGADEYAGTTLVELLSFDASPGDASVDLSWQTGSELSNLGFHVHRSETGHGPWERVTSSLIPGLGSSPEGASYSWTDRDLLNGTRYYYRLEDIDTASVSTFHGPVSAVPVPSAGGGEGGGGEPGVPVPPSGPPGGTEPPPSGETPPPAETSCVDGEPCLYGDPGEPSFQVLAQSTREITVELRTPGFLASPDPDGLSVEVAGFASPTRSHAVDLPFKRALLDAVVGRRARLVSIETRDEVSFPDLRPASLGTPEVDTRPDGTVRPVRRRLPVGPDTLSVPRARIAGDAFMGHAKKLALEIHPLRWDPAQNRLVLSRTLRVRIAFAGDAPGETGAGSFGRRNPRPRRTAPPVFAHFHTTEKGLHAVAYEDVFPSPRRAAPLSALRLVQDGRVVPFHVEPPAPVFGPGSVLFFHADRTASSTDYSGEVSWALERASGAQMATGSAAPTGAPLVSASYAQTRFETEKIYQSGLLDAPDIWLWDFVTSGTTKDLSLDLEAVDTTSALQARVRLYLQGASDSAVTGEHHITASWNGVLLDDVSFKRKLPYLLEGTVSAASLNEGTNTLTLTNVGDTGVSSLVFLDKVEVDYPQLGTVRAERFSGAWTEDGVAQVTTGTPSADSSSHAQGRAPRNDSGGGALSVIPSPLAGVSGEESAGEGPGIRSFVASPSRAPQDDSGGRTPSRAPRALAAAFSPLIAVDITDPVAPVWLSGLDAGFGSVSLHVAADHRYALVSPEGLLSPRVSRVASVARGVETGLRDTRLQADYILVAPQAFIDAAQPLLLRRESQGLTTFAASLEQIAADFGGGAPSGEAIRSFLAFAFHSWKAPAPRYVLLLGDASYDPRNFTGSDPGAPLPALWTKTSYLWTASDPALAAVNGEDLLPDLALGRLPATNLAQAEALVRKVLDWEDAGYDLSGPVTLVADNPDRAGDFEADIADISNSFLGARSHQSLLIRLLGADTRPAIFDSMNSGISLLSYVGHGGSAVWASENVLNSLDTPSLQAQSRQPLMLTMNCLNGYFVSPAIDALAEAFLKVEGRGTIAAFSPSGLSLDGPAHVFHRAMVNEVVNGNHERLGDVVLAGQQAYAASGQMPELLAVYHLLGDPAMKIR